MNLIEFSWVCSQVKLLRIIQQKQFTVKEKWILKIFVRMERSILWRQGTLINQTNSILIAKGFNWVNFLTNMTLSLSSLVFQERSQMRALELKSTVSLTKSSISLNGNSHQSGKWLKDTLLLSLRSQVSWLLRLFILRIRTSQLLSKVLAQLKSWLI